MRGDAKLMLFCCFVFVTSITVLAQNMPTHKQQIVMGIEYGNYVAALEAGNSGDKSFIPLLRRALKQEHNEDFLREVPKALAKLGDARSYNQIICKLHKSEDPVERSEAVADLKYIGGWAAIRQMYPLLADTPENNVLLSYSDVIFGSMKEQAVYAMFKLAPGASIPELGGGISESDPQLQERAALWQKWIDENRSSLQKLEPVGTEFQPTPRSCANLFTGKEPRGASQ